MLEHMTESITKVCLVWIQLNIFGILDLHQGPLKYNYCLGVHCVDSSLEGCLSFLLIYFWIRVDYLLYAEIFSGRLII